MQCYVLVCCFDSFHPFCASFFTSYRLIITAALSALTPQLLFNWQISIINCVNVHLLGFDGYLSLRNGCVCQTLNWGSVQKCWVSPVNKCTLWVTNESPGLYQHLDGVWDQIFALKPTDHFLKFFFFRNIKRSSSSNAGHVNIITDLGHYSWLIMLFNMYVRYNHRFSVVNFASDSRCCGKSRWGGGV